MQRPAWVERVRPLFVVMGYLVGLAGLFGGMLLLNVHGALFADFTAPGIAGPGIDVWVDPLATAGTPARLDVEARGGDRAAVGSVRVERDGEVVAELDGRGPHWGAVISERRTRGSDAVVVEVPIPASAAPGVPLRHLVEVRYWVAMSSGGYFTNQSHVQRLRVDVVPASGPAAARARLVLRAVAGGLGWSLVWIALAGVIWLFDRPGASETEAWAIAGPLLATLVCGSVLGYWLFARPLTFALGLGWVLEYALVAGWVVAGPLLAWRAHVRLRGGIRSHRG